MDSLEAHKNDKREPPKSKYKSLAEIFSSFITEGSTPDEVVKVQGKPDLILPEDNKESYFYGKSEIVFKNGFVSNIDDIDSIIKYAGNCNQLSISSDPIERRYADYIIDRRIKATSPQFLK